MVVIPAGEAVGLGAGLLVGLGTGLGVGLPVPVVVRLLGCIRIARSKPDWAAMDWLLLATAPLLLAKDLVVVFRETVWFWLVTAGWLAWITLPRRLGWAVLAVVVLFVAVAGVFTVFLTAAFWVVALVATALFAIALVALAFFTVVSAVAVPTVVLVAPAFRCPRLLFPVRP